MPARERAAAAGSSFPAPPNQGDDMQRRTLGIGLIGAIAAVAVLGACTAGSGGGASGGAASKPAAAGPAARDAAPGEVAGAPGKVAAGPGGGSTGGGGASTLLDSSAKIRRVEMTVTIRRAAAVAAAADKAGDI